MKKICIITLSAALLCGGSHLLQAQITLTSSGMATANTVITTDQVESDYEDNLDLGNPGANQNWNFSAAPTINYPQSQYFLSPLQTPFPTQFASADLASTDELSDTADYAYYSLMNASFARLGVAGAGSVLTFNPPLKLFDFPFTYQSSLTQNSQVSGTSEGLTVTGTASTQVVADAWGTVTTSLGTLPCLRVKRITELNLTVLFFSIIQRDTVLEWWTNQYEYPVFEYNRNYSSLLGEEDYGSYALVLKEQSVPTKEPGSPGWTNIQATPNPVGSHTLLSFEIATSGKTEVLMVDAAGRTIARHSLGIVAPGTHTQTIDLSNASPGTYVVLLRQEGKLLGVKQLVKN